jgi:hypothetical protein
VGQPADRPARARRGLLTVATYADSYRDRRERHPRARASYALDPRSLHRRPRCTRSCSLRRPAIFLDRIQSAMRRAGLRESSSVVGPTWGERRTPTRSVIDLPITRECAACGADWFRRARPHVGTTAGENAILALAPAARSTPRSKHRRPRCTRSCSHHRRAIFLCQIQNARRHVGPRICFLVEDRTSCRSCCRGPRRRDLLATFCVRVTIVA